MAGQHYLPSRLLTWHNSQKSKEPDHDNQRCARIMVCDSECSDHMIYGGSCFFEISKIESHYLMSNKKVLVTRKFSSQSLLLSHQVPRLSKNFHHQLN